MPEKAKQPAADMAAVNELTRAIEAKDRELAGTYALINHYKERVDDLDLKLVNTTVRLRECQARLAAATPAAPADTEASTH